MLADSAARKIKRYAELSLAYCEAAPLIAFGIPFSHADRIRIRRKKSLMRSKRYVKLAVVHLKMAAGDLSHNLEAAIEHYRTAARICEEEGSPLFLADAADIWGSLANVLLNYPVEHRRHYAKLALDVLLPAEEQVTADARNMEPPPDWLRHPDVLHQLPAIQRLKTIAPYVWRVRMERREQGRTGLVNPAVMGVSTDLLLHKIYWQMGRAHAILGATDKAIQSFDLALRHVPKHLSEIQVVIEIEKGQAYLGATSGDRLQNLDMAGKSFLTAAACCEKDGFIKPQFHRQYVLALIGDARVFLERLDLNAMDTAAVKQRIPIAIKQLRTACRLARRQHMLQLLIEALYLLGRVFGRQVDARRSYLTTALAARVVDRLQRSARTPRFTDFVVGIGSKVDDFLIRIAYDYMSRLKHGRETASRRPPQLSVDWLFCYAERGRTRLLQTEIANRIEAVPDEANEAQIAALYEMRRHWQEAEVRFLGLASAAHLGNDDLKAFDAQRCRLESQYRRELACFRETVPDSSFDPDAPRPAVRHLDLCKTLPRYLKRHRIAVVEYHFTSRWLMVFTMLPTTVVCRPVKISLEELREIEELWQRGQTLLGSHGNPVHWERGYLGQVLERLKPLLDAPKETIRKWEFDHRKSIKKVIVVPHKFLHLIPLHAIPGDGGSVWGESTVIQYCPSSSVLYELLRSADDGGADTRNMAERVTDEVTGSSIAVGYSAPSGERQLAFCQIEAASVAELTFGRVLAGADATPRRVKDEIRRATHIHFSCHGSFNPESPLDSALLLHSDDGASGDAKSRQVPKVERASAAGGGQLTAGEILRDVRLMRRPLVVLSACKTGLARIEERHEEYLGLPAAFLYAGASSVISSLWPVDDVATWFLMREFTRELSCGRDATTALRSAQAYVRALPREEVIRAVTGVAAMQNDGVIAEHLEEVGRRLAGSAAYPFASPYWWAGFIVTGLPV